MVFLSNKLRTFIEASVDDADNAKLYVFLSNKLRTFIDACADDRANGIASDS